MSQTVEVPLTLLRRLADASESFHALEEELEDFLLARDPKLLARLERARAQHLSGELRPFSGLRKG